MLLEYYLLVKQQIATIAALEEVEWYTGQFEQTGDQTLYVDSAAYIEFSPLDMEQMGGKVQESTIEFTVYLINTVLLNGEKRITDPAINHLGIMGDIYKALTHYAAKISELPAYSGLAGTPQDIVVVNSLVRTNITPIHELSNLMITSQVFQGTWMDLSAHVELQPVNATLNINVTNT